MVILEGLRPSKTPRKYTWELRLSLALPWCLSPQKGREGIMVSEGAFAPSGFPLLLAWLRINNFEGVLTLPALS